MDEMASALRDRVTKAKKVAGNRFWPNKVLDKPKPKRVRSETERQYRRWVRRNELHDSDDDMDNMDFHFRFMDMVFDYEAEREAAEREQEGR
jgi:hypothetical protein